MGQLVEKLFDMLFTQSRCARNQGLEMFLCFLLEISIFSQQKWDSLAPLFFFPVIGKNIDQVGFFNFLDYVKHFCVSLLCFSNFGKTCGGESAFFQLFGLC